MAKQELLSKEAKIFILKQIEEDAGEISIDDVMDLVRPHFIFDYQLSREQAIRRKAKNLIASIKDEQGIRRVFSKGNNVYVDVDTTKDEDALRYIEEELEKKYASLSASRKKVSNRRRVLEGQMQLFKQA